MSENAIKYLTENKEKYTQEALVAQLRETGYSEGDISESIKAVFGGEGAKPSTGKAKADNVANKIGKVLLVVGAVFILLIFASAFMAGEGTSREKGRDAKRLSDVKQLQAALELYYDSCGAYPVVSNTTVIGSPNFDTSFNGGCQASTNLGTFIYPLPVNPTPEGEPYTYYGSGKSYTISFSLEKKAGNLSRGRHFATPAGIQ